MAFLVVWIIAHCDVQQVHYVFSKKQYKYDFFCFYSEVPPETVIIIILYLYKLFLFISYALAYLFFFARQFNVHKLIRSIDFYIARVRNLIYDKNDALILHAIHFNFFT